MKTLVVAPHPDDELLGCGGTLLRRTAEGGTVGWLLMTAITEEGGWSRERIEQRAAEIEKVRDGLGIVPQHLYRLDFPTAQLDQQPMDTLIFRVSEVFRDFEPEEVLLPHPGDAHSDHRVTFDAARHVRSGSGTPVSGVCSLMKRCLRQMLGLIQYGCFSRRCLSMSAITLSGKLN